MAVSLFGDRANGDRANGGAVENSGTAAVEDFSLRVAAGELLVLFGPSGCGKSTLLRLVAGLETCSSGQVWLGGADVSRRSPGQRKVSLVVQSLALYPHLSVQQNLSFGLSPNAGGSLAGDVGVDCGEPVGSGSGSGDLARADQPRGFLANGLGVFHVLRRSRRSEGLREAADSAASRELPESVQTRVRQTAAMLGITSLLGRRPHSLSGGERQRVALGRAIVRNPAAFLLDEPLSGVDGPSRVAMREEFRALQKRLGVTSIYVTHDWQEAMTLADRVAVMDRGRLVQVGVPSEIYRRPATSLVASLCASLPMNLSRGALVKGGGAEEKVSASRDVWDFEGSAGWRVPQAFAARSLVADVAGLQPAPAVIGVRPESIAVVSPWGGSAFDLTATVCRVVDCGEYCLLTVRLGVLGLPEKGDAVPEVDDAVPEVDEVLVQDSAGRSAFAIGQSDAGNADGQVWGGRLADCETDSFWRVKIFVGSSADQRRLGQVPEAGLGQLAAVGQRVGLRIDRQRLHLFDVETGRNLRKDLDETE